MKRRAFSFSKYIALIIVKLQLEEEHAFNSYNFSLKLLAHERKCPRQMGN